MACTYSRDKILRCRVALQIEYVAALQSNIQKGTCDKRRECNKSPVGKFDTEIETDDGDEKSVVVDTRVMAVDKHRHCVHGVLGSRHFKNNSKRTTTHFEREADRGDVDNPLKKAEGARVADCLRVVIM